MIPFRLSPFSDRLLRLLAVLLAIVWAPALQAAAATAPRSPQLQVLADASYIGNLTESPCPYYPSEAAEKGWAGVGVFELHFRPDGKVENVAVILSTEHKVLDNAACATLLRWRCKPGAQTVGRLTVVFGHRDRPMEVKPGTNHSQRNFIFAPHPDYPVDARRWRQTGYGVFLLRMRPDGTVSDVVAIKPIGVPILDQECLSKFRRWRAFPGVFKEVKVPIAFRFARGA